MVSKLHNNQTSDELRLQPKEIRFPHPEMLKRTELDDLDSSLWDELCIAETECDLGKDTELLNDADFINDVNSYKLLKLSANEEIKFDRKDSLKRYTSIRRPVIWLTTAAAAVITLFIFTGILTEQHQTFTPIVADNNILDINKYEQQDVQPMNEKVAVEKLVSTDMANNTPVKDVTKQVKAAGVSNTQQAVKPKSKETESPTIEHQSRHEVQLASITKPIKQTVVITTMAETGSIALRPVEPAYSPSYVDVDDDSKGSLLRTIAQHIGIAKVKDPNKKISTKKYTVRDMLSEKGILALNMLLDKETMVIKEYDNEGNLTLYAVESSTFGFQKTYN